MDDLKTAEDYFEQGLETLGKVAQEILSCQSLVDDLRKIWENQNARIPNENQFYHEKSALYHAFVFRIHTHKAKSLACISCILLDDRHFGRDEIENKILDKLKAYKIGLEKEECQYLAAAKIGNHIEESMPNVFLRNWLLYQTNIFDEISWLLRLDD